MGVMPCQRGNCSAILCNRYSNKYGYICNACFEELVNSNLSIKEFLETDVGIIEDDIREMRRKYLETIFKE